MRRLYADREEKSVSRGDDISGRDGKQKQLDLNDPNQRSLLEALTAGTRRPPREQVGAHRLTHQGGQPLRTFSETQRPLRNHDADCTRRPDNDLAFNARITAAIAFGFASGLIRTVTPSISSSIPLDNDRHCDRRGCGSKAGSAPTTACTNIDAMGTQQQPADPFDTR